MLIRALLLSVASLCSAQSDPTSIFDPRDLYLAKQFVDSITAYGPGVGVFGPYSYVDASYDNLPFVGKVIPILGKEGTSSRLGISPFYPPGGNPSNPIPPLYRARPLPLHIPEPVDVVAVPLDEEALHGEPLFPKELVLPEFMEMAGKAGAEQTDDQSEIAPVEPFASIDESAFATAEKKVSGNGIDDIAEQGDDDMVLWPSSGFSSMTGPLDGNSAHDVPQLTIEDAVKEKSTKMEEMVSEAKNEPVPMGDGRGGRRRIRRLAQILLGADYV